MKGVYAIFNRVSGKFYIGSAVDVGVRWNSHRSALRRGDHVNRHLQAAWDKHGVDAFTCLLIEAVDDDESLTAREQAWLDESQAPDPNIGYNLSPTAGNTLGYRFSSEQRAALRGKPKSPEHRANIWRSREVTDEFRARMASNGRKRAGQPKSLEHRRKIGAAQRGSRNHQAKLTEEIVDDIKRRLALGERGRHLAVELGVSEATVSEIKHGRKWAHVEAAAA